MLIVILRHLWSEVASQNIYQRIVAYLLVGAIQRTEGLLHQNSTIEAVGWVHANVAMVAVMVNVFSKVRKQDASATDVGLGILLHALQLLQIDALLTTFTGKLREGDDIAQRIEKQSLAGHAVASSTSHLLIVVLQTLRHVVVDDPAHITLVDAHAESDGGAYHLHTVVDEVLLRLVALQGSHASMIDGSVNVMNTQHLADLLRIGTA